MINEIIEFEAFNHPYLYLFFISFILSVIISYKSRKQSDSNQLYNKFFILCNITLGIWAFLVIFKLLLAPTILQIYFHGMVLVTATINVWSLMMFIYYYTNTSIPKNIAWGSLIPLVILAIITLVSFYINFDSYNIYFTTKDVAFYTIPFEQDIYMQILIITHFIYGFIGLTILFLYSRKQKNQNKNQYYWIILANMVIVGGGMISALRLDPYSNIHIYPAFFSIFFLIIWKSIYNTNLFNVLPIARTEILESLTQGVIVINRNNKIIDSNKSAKNICNQEELYMKNIYEIYPEINDKIDNLKEETYIENFCIEIDGEINYYNIKIEPLYNNASNYIGSTLSFDNITKLKENQFLLEERQKELKKQKQKLEIKTDELQRQNEKLENFASIISHDIRNPLSVAHGYSQLIKQNPDNDENYDNLVKSLDRIENIIDDVLELALQGKTVTDTTDTDLESIVNESWGMLEFSDAVLTVEDTIKFDSDKSRLKNVFENLFRNSKEHKQNDIETEIRVGPLKNKNGFYIEDNGPGIPVNKRENIFDYGTTYSEDGTGFGLAIVKEIVTAHNWDIIIKDGEHLSGVRFEIIFDE